MEYATERVGATADTEGLGLWSLRGVTMSLPAHMFVRIACQLSASCSARGFHRGSF